jgi:hypothetical protein
MRTGMPNSFNAYIYREVKLVASIYIAITPLK